MLRLLIMCAVLFSGWALAGPKSTPSASLMAQAEALVQDSDPGKAAKVKGPQPTASHLKLVPANFDTRVLKTPPRTVSKRKHKLTVERSKSATLIRLGDTSRSP